MEPIRNQDKTPNFIFNFKLVWQTFLILHLWDTSYQELTSRTSNMITHHKCDLDWYNVKFFHPCNHPKYVIRIIRNLVGTVQCKYSLSFTIWYNKFLGSYKNVELYFIFICIARILKASNYFLLLTWQWFILINLRKCIEILAQNVLTFFFQSLS